MVFHPDVTGADGGPFAAPDGAPFTVTPPVPVVTPTEPLIDGMPGMLFVTPAVAEDVRRLLNGSSR